MTTLLVIIYITFISLGLPDAVLGSAWPQMHIDLNSTIPAAGIMAMIVSGGTIVSSLLSGRLIDRFGTSKVTAVSVVLTALGLVGIAFTPNFFIMCLLGVPLGLGAGAVDSGLNNFVALHYNAKHMNWLHCFWGIGATSGPILMSFFLLKQGGWQAGYLVIGIMQLVLAIGLFFTFPLWKRVHVKTTQEEEKVQIGLGKLIQIRGAKSALIGFFCYSSIEIITGLWGSSYLVLHKGMSAATAAKWIAFFYMGITIGRFIAGIMTMRLNNINMIRVGQVLITMGFASMLLAGNQAQILGFMLLGLGCAPIFPAMLHETPNRFGRKISQGIMGIQMAIAYVGATFMPPLVGYVTNHIGFGVFPVIIISFVILMVLSTEHVNRIIAHNKKEVGYSG